MFFFPIGDLAFALYILFIDLIYPHHKIFYILYEMLNSASLVNR